MKSWFLLFLQTFAIVFAGFVLCNISAVAINDIFDGFGLFLEQLSNLPYLVYFIFSLIISSVLTLVFAK